MNTAAECSFAASPAVLLDTNVDREEWEAHFHDVPQPHFPQAWVYGEGKRTQGYSPQRWAVRAEGRVLALCQVLVKRPLGLPVARINRGPLFLPCAADPATRLAVLRALRRHWRFGLRGVLLIAPSLTADEDGATLMRAAGYLRRGSFSWGSAWIDLQGSPETLRAALSSKWRTKLNGSLKAGLDLRHSQEPQAFHWMLERHAANMQQKGFAGPPVTFVRAMIDARPQDFHVFQAFLGGEPISGNLVVRFGAQAECFLAWTGETARRCNAHHLALWHSMMAMKADGARALDLGGYSSSEDKYGAFKRGMKGREYRLSAEWLAF